MKRFVGGVSAILLLALVMGRSSGSDKKVAIFEGKDTLLRPESYREWVFVGSSLGLRYEENDEKQRPEELEYKNVYINPSAYRRVGLF